jgi:hypothetical protein
VRPVVRDALALEVLARVQRDFFALGDIHGGERVFGDLAAARHAHVGVAVAITVAKGRPLALAQLSAPYLVSCFGLPHEAPSTTWPSKALVHLSGT